MFFYIEIVPHNRNRKELFLKRNCSPAKKCYHAQPKSLVQVYLEPLSPSSLSNSHVADYSQSPTNSGEVTHPLKNPRCLVHFVQLDRIQSITFSLAAPLLAALRPFGQRSLIFLRETRPGKWTFCGLLITYLIQGSTNQWLGFPLLPYVILSGRRETISSSTTNSSASQPWKPI